MSDELGKVMRLKEKVEALRSEAERARGALDSVLSRLKDDHGCATIGEAEEKLKTLREKREKGEKALRKATEEFEGRWGDLL